MNQDKQLFPFCIVWTVLPCIGWILPWIGHVGICDSQGNIFDFLGYHINTGTMAFGRVIKYVRLYPQTQQKFNQGIFEANNKFRNEGHNLCCNNCHHHVAFALNEMRYEGKSNWTQLDIWWFCLAHSKYVNWCSILKVYLPFLVIVGLIVGLIISIKS